MNAAFKIGDLLWSFRKYDSLPSLYKMGTFEYVCKLPLDHSAIVVGVPFGSRIHVLTSYGIFWAHGGHFTDDEKTT